MSQFAYAVNFGGAARVAPLASRGGAGHSHGHRGAVDCGGHEFVIAELAEVLP